jgi:hypothetical protein
MYVYEAAVVGVDDGDDGPYSHAKDLESAGFLLGAGCNSMRVSGR